MTEETKKVEEKQPEAEKPAEVDAAKKEEAPKAEETKKDDKAVKTDLPADKAGDKPVAKNTTKTDDKKDTKSSSGGGQDSSPFKRRKRVSEYGQQLMEKQSAKKIYGIRERQFRNYYQKALNTQGDTGDNLRQLLQMRLDNVVYQAGLAKTTAAARQMVSHNFFLVNGKKVNIPSYQVKIKDIISIKPEKVEKKVWGEEFKERLEGKEIPSWLAVDKKENTVKVTAKPTGNELDQSFSPRLIVEFYSR